VGKIASAEDMAWGTRMRVAQAVFGAFHHFELARELERRGHLDRIYSTWPWSRLKREGLLQSKVETFPWIHTPVTVLERAGVLPRSLSDDLGVWNARAFDDWTYGRIGECDALIAIAGAALKTGRLVQQRGGKFISDRGSTHPRYQDNIVREEYRRWGVDLPVSDPRDTLREEEIYEASDAISVPSSLAARTFVEMGIPAEKVHVIPYGVRLEAFAPVAEPEMGGFDVLFAGSVGLRKGVPYLLQAFALLRHPRKRLRIAGALHEDLRALLVSLPKQHVEFLGIVPQTELVRLMSCSHAFVLPSIEEGLALVQAQAMACRCPVICSTNTGGEDLFTDGVEGFIVPIRDANAIARCLQKLADDPTMRREMGDASIRRMQSLGGWADYGDRWEALLRKLSGI